MVDRNDETLQVYIEESLEHLQDIEQDLLQIESDGAAVNEGLVNKVFRAVHSIKGGASFIGLVNIRELSHGMENVLGLVRARRLVPNAEIVTLLLTAADVLKRLIDNFEQGEQQDVAHLVEGLSEVASQNHMPVQDADIGSGDGQGIRLATSGGSLVFDLTAEQAAAAKEHGRNLYLVRFSRAACDTSEVAACGPWAERLGFYGDILASSDDHEQRGAQQGSNDHRDIIFSCVLQPEDIVLLFEGGSEDVYLIDDDYRCIELKQKCDQPEAPPSDREASLRRRLEEGRDPETPPPEDVRPAAMSDTILPCDDSRRSSADRAPYVPQAGSPSSVRVKVQLLESLMNLASELVLGRNQLLQAIATRNARKIELVGQRLDMVTSELQEAIMLTRMQPVGRLFNRFHRMARDIARDLGKEVQLKISGEDVELDRKLLEAINDPITHLVRNAIDHGIEPAAVRKRLGKGEIGSIQLRAFHQAGQVIIEVSDDGGGIDTESLASTAVAKGFVADDQVKRMSLREKMNLVFLPGLSSASDVSEISGRGVGMDVVRNNIDNLGGVIDLDSLPGKGTRIRIKLPLTLAIIPCQIVRVEAEKYAIPQINIEELLRIPAAQVKRRVEIVGQAPVLRLRGELLPLVRLSDTLNIERTYIDPKTMERKPDQRDNIADRRSRKWDESGREISAEAEESPPVQGQDARSGADRRYHASSSLSIVVVDAGVTKYGLIVDSFLDSAEIVVKPLGYHLRDCQAYAGATIMGDGRVAFILDVGNLAGLANLAQLAAVDNAAERSKESAGSDAARQNFLLTFRNAEDEPMAVPLDQVVRIQRIPFSSLETAGGMRVMPYGGRSLPVLAVHEVATVQPLAEKETMVAIIFCVEGHEVGLLANGPLDSVQTAVDIDTRTLAQPGISGSLILDGRTTLLVDILELTRHRYPNWLDKITADAAIRKRRSTILVVEDSSFFRTHITELLEEEGYSTLAAEDGEVGWALLQQSMEEVALVVTDLEMPKLDGFDLTRRIRNHDRLSGLPVIALTTLADDQDIERGRALGVDDYQIKLDKEKFIESVRNLLNKGN
ncbi:hybrid sensor histidine kinase/response regulator [Desulfoferrobacter suflitae]|uniref:hybrid sensor histidine kinase/response regulator n=1 Tax=Desulfoferrobacter suflitae TaxID=2865782 RepID=UPI0021644193|nr:chemotaxis protein CheW [Desulfoferrobacter suflitae]MCK8601548.1 chemotaxis protein CheW [Desulfoferrobacter suflitae]